VTKMGFDINEFANEFKKTIDWMLEGSHAQEIKNDLKNFENNKKNLENNPDYIEALRMIIELIKTKGWRLRLPRNFDNKWNSFMKKHGTNFRTPEAQEELIELVGNQYIERLFEYSTLKDFTDNLYNLAKKGKTEVLGPKGRDNYLRDFGYWDRIPIDIHEKRFIIRSGIYHSCSSKQQSDPLDKDDLQDTLTTFCTEHLKECVVKKEDIGIDTDIKLCSAPGIVDIFIWSFSAEDRYNICGVTPKCDECKLKGVCLYALTNSQ